MHGLDIVSRDLRTIISLENEGFEVVDIRINAPEQNNVFEELEGMHGRFHQGSQHSITTIEVDVEYKMLHDLDFSLSRDKLVGLVSNTEPFYIREKRAKYQHVEFERPGEKKGDLLDEGNEYASGKQYLVVRTGSISFEQVALRGRATVTFETAQLPYAESVYSTMDIHNNGILYDGKWSYGMGLLLEDGNRSTWNYRFTASPFNVFNAGDVTIDNWRMYRQIKVIVGSTTSKLRIYDATGRYLEINQSMVAGDIILIEGPRVYLNGINILSSTNKYFLKIFKGQNEFKVEGATFTIEFDFKYYYGSTDLNRMDTLVPRDTTPPNAPAVESIIQNAAVIKGTSEEGATIVVTFPNGTQATGLVAIDGSFAINVPSGVALATGNNITVTATDRAGNVSAVTTKTVQAYPYNPLTVTSTKWNIDRYEVTLNNAVMDKAVKSVFYDSLNRKIKNEVTGPLSTTSVALSYSESDLSAIARIDYYIVEPATYEQLSDIIRVNIAQNTAAGLNLWRSSNKDYSATLNSAGRKQFTEVFTVVGNAEQEIDVKTLGDSLTVDGGPADMRFYELTGLKANTTYTLSYVPSWTYLDAGLHTHAWGVGFLMNNQIGKRQSFTFTTNAQGKYGYGNGATMDTPASNVLNIMHADSTTNEVKYEKITLNEGSMDLGYTPGTVTGV